MRNYRLTPTDFYSAVKRIRQIGERPREAAYAVLVDGMTLSEASHAIGISREAVRVSAKRVRESWELMNGGVLFAAKNAAEHTVQSAMKEESLPGDWKAVAVCLPPRLADIVKDIERTNMRKLGG